MRRDGGCSNWNSNVLIVMYVFLFFLSPRYTPVCFVLVITNYWSTYPIKVLRMVLFRV